MDQAGLVAMAMAGLWIAYLVPHRLRYRQQLLESRADDRFSEHLRVVRVARAPRATTRVVRSAAGPTRVLLHPAAARSRGDGPMDRPHGAQDRVVADAARRTAAAHAARAAALTSRAAGARRRAALSALLLVATLAGWVAVALTPASAALGAVPSVLLAGVLVLGRRAVVAGHRADAAWAAGAATRAPLAGATRTTGVVGRAVHPSEAVTEVLPRAASRDERSGVERLAVAERALARATERAERAERRAEGAERAASTPRPVERAAPAGAAGPADVAGWVPVPVPPPAYTLKPEARRAEPSPLVLDDLPAAPAARSEAPAPDAGAARPTTGGLSLDAILARRRASGE